MIIGHLPAGYLAFSPFRHRLSTIAFTAGVIASILPDFDMIWHYMIDHGAVHHHRYYTHQPILWVTIAAFGLLVFARSKDWGQVIVAIGLGGTLHVALDTITGSISWLWPMSDKTFTLVHVPPTHENWIYSFLAHWTFLVEILILFLATIVFFVQRRRDRAG